MSSPSTFFFGKVQTALENIQNDYSIQQAMNLSTASNLPSLMSVSPQTVVTPVSYTIVNLVPFDQPVYVFPPFLLQFSHVVSGWISASAVTFVGLIYLLIMSFFVVVSGFHTFFGVYLNTNGN